MALMCLSSLLRKFFPLFPQVLESSVFPPVPNPILESQLLQLFSWLLMIPILAFEWSFQELTALNPSLLQLLCKAASEPISVIHVLRPSEVTRYFPSAISEYRELPVIMMAIKLSCWPIFIPRQILEKDVFQ